MYLKEISFDTLINVAAQEVSGKIKVTKTIKYPATDLANVNTDDAQFNQILKSL